MQLNYLIRKIAAAFKSIPHGFVPSSMVLFFTGYYSHLISVIAYRTFSNVHYAIVAIRLQLQPKRIAHREIVRTKLARATPFYHCLNI
jgi:hypothetical protein